MAPTLSKAEAGYTNAHGGRYRCGTCTMYRKHGDEFDPPDYGGTCTLVQGEISSQGWCRHYDEKKAEERANAEY